MPPPAEIERRIERLDLGLFDAIFTQSLDGDRMSWLALQRAVRTAKGFYVYLEIGSYLGGSLQPHFVDPRCRLIYSIDKRTPAAPDDRGEDFRYEGNTTAEMLRNLRRIDEHATAKVVPFDTDAQDIDRSRIDQPPNLCFIDGEHTTDAVLSDFEFCRAVAARDAVLYFHDDNIIRPAIDEVVRRLGDAGIAFLPLKLGGVTFAIALGEPPLLGDDFLPDLERHARRLGRRDRLKQIIPPPLRRTARWLARGLRGS
jgi:hypothetical protein